MVPVYEMQFYPLFTRHCTATAALSTQSWSYFCKVFFLIPDHCNRNSTGYLPSIFISKLSFWKLYLSFWKTLCMRIWYILSRKRLNFCGRRRLDIWPTDDIQLIYLRVETSTQLGFPYFRKSLLEAHCKKSV